MKKIFLLMCILFVMVLTGCQEDVCAEKPVIYLYPEQETEVEVQLDYDGTLICTYPEYNTGAGQYVACVHGVQRTGETN